MQLAKSSNERVEISGARSETAAVFANPDGTVSVQEFTGPRWVRRERVNQGKKETYFVDVDTTLQAAGGSVTAKAVSSGLELSPGGSARLGEIRRDGRAVTAMLPAGVVLPTPVVSGSSARYADVYPGVDLVATALTTGVEYSWVLTRRPTGPVALELLTAVEGMTVRTVADGGVEFVGSRGGIVARQSAAVMFDSSVGPDGLSGLARARAVAGSAVAESVRTSTAPGASVSQGVRATFRPDMAFLNDPNTVYPVTIDPQVTWGESYDTYVSSTYPSSTYFTQQALHAGKSTTWGSVRSYVGISDAMYNALGDTQVSTAELWLYVTASGSCYTTTAVAVSTYRDATVFGSGTNWSNKPLRSPTAAVSSRSFNPPIAGPSCPGANWDKLDVKAIAQAWADRTYTVKAVEVGASETDTTAYKQFSSGETTNGPYFYVTYNQRPAVPTPVQPLAGWAMGSTAFDVTATVSDPDGSTVHGHLWLQDVSSGNTWVTPSTGVDCSEVAS